MKNSFLFAFAIGAALTFAACNTAETHDRAADKPAGETPGPANGEEARDQRGDDPNESGDQAAAEHGK